jgi:branched-chain amino acid transport system permease protein
MFQKKNLWWLVALIAFAAFPLLQQNPSYRSIGVWTLVYMASAASWNIFSGYSGYIALGSGVFFGSGAYTMALISNHAHMAPGASLFWLVPVAGVVAMAISVPFGWIALRVRRHTFVVITIAFFFIFQNFASNVSFTGGTSGMQLPFITWGVTYYDLPFYYVALGLVIFVTVLSALVRRSRFGLQLLAIRDDEDRALGLGVNVMAVKMTGFAISSFAIGACGAIYALYIGQVYPAGSGFAFDPLFDLSIAMMTFLGGLGTLVGPLLGALILESAQQYLTVNYSNGSLYLILLGALFLGVFLLMPQGIIPYVRDRVTKRADREKAQVADTDLAMVGGDQ